MCKTGGGCFAQDVANKTGAKVTAPEHNVNVQTSTFPGEPRVRDAETSERKGRAVYELPGKKIHTFKPKK